MANNDSKALRESLDGYVDPKIKANLENLKNLGIEPSLFAQFEARVNDIIGKNPGSEGVVTAELEKTNLGMENLLSKYNREFRSIVTGKAANDDFSGDEDKLAA